MKKSNVLLIAAATAFTMTSAMASPAGSWTGSVGIGYVNPTSDNGSVLDNALDVDVDSNVRPTLTGEYFVADNIGVEVLAAVPFQHDIQLTNKVTGAKIDAETKHLPPTVSVQYHFDDIGGMTGMGLSATPFVGIGLNYTTFFDEQIDIDGSELKIDDTFGVAGHFGIDFPLSVTDSVRLDARYINIEPDVELDGEGIGSVDINPWVYGLSYVRQF